MGLLKHAFSSNFYFSMFLLHFPFMFSFLSYSQSLILLTWHLPETLKVEDSKKSVRKLDLSQLCFSLNFLFSYVLCNFLLCFPLLTYSQSFFSLSADHLRHSRRRRSKISILLIQETV